MRKDYLPQRNRRLAFEELESLCLLSGGTPLTAGVLTPPHGTGAAIVTTLVGTSGGLSGPTDSTYFNGDLYVPNTGTNTISEVTLGGVVSTYVNNTQGLNTPDGLTFDNEGNLYVANFHGETISKVTPGGTVSTFADVNSPNSPVFGPNGNLYVCDKYDGTIVEITPAGVVTTFVDNTHGLSYPIALAFDDNGNLYIDSQNNSTIYKVTSGGSVSVFASGGLINSPTDIVFGPGGNLYVYNSGTSAITEVTPAGVVSNFLTLDSAVAGTYAGLVFDASGDLYVINNGNSTITKIAPPTLVEGQAFSDQTVFHFTDANSLATASQFTAVVTLGDGNSVTLGSSGVVGTGPAGAGGQIVADAGGGFDVQLSYAYAEAFSNQTFSVQVTDEGGAPTGASTNNFSVADAPLTAGALTPPHGTGAAIVTTLVGTSGGLSGPTQSTYFNGDLYVPNTGTNTISEVTLAGVVSTYVDSAQGLNTPDGLTFDSEGNLYVANFHGETISKVTPGGTVSTFADVNSPNSPVFGPNGNLYVCDKYDGTIVEITPGGVVTTFVDNTHGLSYPIALAFDDSGNLYIDSQNNSTIYKVTSGGTVSVFASGGLINSPTDMVFGPGGNLYVYNSGTSAITEVTPAGVVSNFLTLDSAVAGTYAGLVFDASGDLYVINNGNSTISKIAPPTFPTLVVGQPFSDQTVFHFTDANSLATASQFTAVVTLGDGNSVTLGSSGVVGTGPARAGGQIVADAGGGFDVQLSYAYAEAFSNRTFSVQVTDEGGAPTGASTNNFSVTDVVLTVTPVTGQSHVYDTPLPILGYNISGFVDGDTRAIVTGALGTTATASSPVGNYAFTLGTLSAGSKYTLQLAANAPTFAVTPDMLMISLESSATITEGQPLTTMGAIVSSTTVSATVDYGDGNGPQPLALAPNATFSLGHVYPSGGSFTATVNVVDSTGLSKTSLIAVTVLNVAPTAQIVVAPIKFPKKGPAIYKGAGSDPGPGDVLHYAWTVTIPGKATKKNKHPLPKVVASGSGQNFSFSTKTKGTYTVTLTVTDDQGATGEASRTIKR